MGVAQARPALSIQAEPFSRLCREAIQRGLFEAHWREVGMFRDRIVLEPDFEKSFQLERAQCLASYSVRDAGGVLVGYAVYICATATHYRSHVCGSCDVLYLAPEHRGGGTAVRLLRMAERDLVARGVSKVVYHFKLEHDQQALMRRLGYEPTETLYEKVVG